MNYNENDAFFKVYGTIITDTLIPLIEKYENSKIWEDKFRETYYPAHNHTENLAFEWTPILAQESFSVYVNTDLLDSDIGQIYQQITEKVLIFIPGILLRGAIIRLKPNTSIHTHIDGTHPLWVKCHRIHLPIITEPEIKFYYKWTNANQTEYASAKHLPKNELVEINNCIPHGVDHHGNKLRYHLMYDILPSSYVDNHTISKHSDKNRFALEREREITERLPFFKRLWE
jgi:hypothetical protein